MGDRRRIVTGIGDRRGRTRRRMRPRLHLGNDERAQGRDAQPPDAARRGRAHPRLDHAGSADPHGFAGHACHRDARCGAGAGQPRRTRPSHRPVGPRPRARHHVGVRRRRRHGCRRVPGQPPRSPGLHLGACASRPARRTGWRARAGLARRTGRRVRHHGHAGLRVDRASVDHGLHVRRSRSQASRDRRATDARRGDPGARRGRQAGPDRSLR